MTVWAVVVEYDEWVGHGFDIISPMYAEKGLAEAERERMIERRMGMVTGRIPFYGYRYEVREWPVKEDRSVASGA